MIIVTLDFAEYVWLLISRYLTAHLSDHLLSPWTMPEHVWLLISTSQTSPLILIVVTLKVEVE